MIRTPLHSLLPSIRVPIVSGPMGGAAGGSLAAQVTKAGGFGFIGGGYLTPSQMSEELQVVHSILGSPPPGQRTEIGVGFLGWKLSRLDKGILEGANFDVGSRPKAFECIDATLKGFPRAIWLAFGTTEDLVGWAKAFREREEVVNGKNRGDSWRLFVGVGSEQEARVAVEQVGADVVVAQGEWVHISSMLICAESDALGRFCLFTGIEAGGHGNGSSPPLSTLLPHIARLLPTYRPLDENTKPLLLGAGGLSSGSHVISCLALGAVGAVYGTRFLLTPESCYPEPRKQILLQAREGSTIRSMAFDEARNTLEWPQGVDGRGLRNATVADYEAGLGDSTGRQDTYARAEKQGDAERLIVWAGTGVGNMDKISPAGDVVRELEQEAIESLERVKSISS